MQASFSTTFVPNVSNESERAIDTVSEWSAGGAYGECHKLGAGPFPWVCATHFPPPEGTTAHAPAPTLPSLPGSPMPPKIFRTSAALFGTPSPFRQTGAALGLHNSDYSPFAEASLLCSLSLSLSLSVFLSLSFVPTPALVLGFADLSYMAKLPTVCWRALSARSTAVEGAWGDGRGGNQRS